MLPGSKATRVDYTEIGLFLIKNIEEHNPSAGEARPTFTENPDNIKLLVNNVSLFWEGNIFIKQFVNNAC